MLWVRYPDGTVIQYNDAAYLYSGQNASDLYTKPKEQGGRWIATVQPSAGVIIEAVRPCAVRNEKDELIADLTKQLRAAKRKPKAK